LEAHENAGCLYNAVFLRSLFIRNGALLKIGNAHRLAVNKHVNMLQKLRRNGILSLKEDTNMPNIRPISDLRNYTSVLKEVKYGERVYLTRNGVGECAIIDMKELDELDKMIALRGLMKDLDRAKARADREGWIDADEAERILGVVD
jgi:prevent-host-death family protein